MNMYVANFTHVKKHGTFLTFVTQACVVFETALALVMQISTHFYNSVTS